MGMHGVNDVTGGLESMSVMQKTGAEYIAYFYIWSESDAVNMAKKSDAKGSIKDAMDDLNSKLADSSYENF